MGCLQAKCKGTDMCSCNHHFQNLQKESADVASLCTVVIKQLIYTTHTHIYMYTLTDDTIGHGVAVVFHKEEGGEGGKGETMVAQDEGDEEEEDEGGVEADYEGVLHADVRKQPF